MAKPIDPDSSPTPRLTEMWSYHAEAAKEIADRLLARWAQLRRSGNQRDARRAEWCRSLHNAIEYHVWCFSRWPTEVVVFEDKAREVREFQLLQAVAIEATKP